MKAKLLSRLGRLETQYQEARQAVMRVGSLKKLPDDYVGERQVVVVKRQQTSTPGYESCEFEERPGPEPPGMRDQAWRIYVAEKIEASCKPPPRRAQLGASTRCSNLIEECFTNAGDPRTPSDASESHCAEAGARQAI